MVRRAEIRARRLVAALHLRRIGAPRASGAFYRVRKCIALVLCLVAAPLHGQQATLSQVSWLNGCWELAGANRRVVEQWSSADGVMTGWSRTWIGGQLRESETVRLVTRGDTLVYEAQPSGQRRAEFRTTSVGGREVVFSNPAHDFPQRIVYSRAGDDSLIARIEGDRGGRAAQVSYPYRRVKCAPPPR